MKTNLTPFQAMLLHLLFHYRTMGEFATEFAAEKLSYFLQRFGEKQLKLNFQKGYYGPYSGKVRHVLYKLNGNYLKGYEGKDLGPFEPFQLNIQKKEEVENYINNLNNEERNRLNKVIELIRGFESPFGLELLATVDFVEQDHHQSSPEHVIRQAQQWSSRKRSLLTEDKIQKARERLHQVLAD